MKSQLITDFFVCLDLVQKAQYEKQSAPQ